MKSSCHRLLPLLLVLVPPHPARGQTNLETNAGIEFNFSTPGASNLGRGGAFIALADDATAAYTNPAGLTQLTQPQVSIEGRSWEYKHVFTDRGRLEGVTPTNTPPDTISGLRDGEAKDRVSGLSFLSYVYPKERFSFAIYRHELVNFEANFRTQGAYLEATAGRSQLGIPGEPDGRLASLDNQMALKVVTSSASAAWRLGKSFSLGVGVSYFDFEIDSVANRYVPELDELADFSLPPVNVQTQQGSADAWGARAGFLWQSHSRVLSFGGAWRQGAELPFTAASRRGAGSELNFSEHEERAQFHVPDSYGLGVAWRPTDAVQITFDWNRVEYSDLTDDLVDIFDLGHFYPGLDPEIDQFRLDDGDELRLGLEVSFSQRKIPFSLRAGVWHDPDHSLRFEGENISFGAIFPRRGDNTHVSLGLGLPFPRFGLDAAVDVSDRVNTASLSTVVRF